MTTYRKDTRHGDRWYFQFLIKRKYYRGGGYYSEREASEAEKAERYRVTSNKRKPSTAIKKRRKEWRCHYPPERDRERHLKDTYSISLEEYQGLFNRQNGICAICGNSPKNEKPLHVDHNHITGKIRGLLCQKCNTGIANFKDDSKLLESALNYLNRS